MVSLTAFQLCPCRAAKCKSSPPQYVNSRDRVQTWPHAGPDLRAVVHQPLVSDIHVTIIAPFFYYGFISSVQSALRIRWPKYWSFSFSISPSNEHPGLISFRMDWLDLLAVQGTLKRLLQHHSSKASILHRSAFFIVQLSHPSMTTGKTIALTRWTFVGRVVLTTALSNSMKLSHAMWGHTRWTGHGGEV